MEKTYSIDKAAYLLGVPPERLREFVSQHLIDTIDEEGEARIPKSEIARLYPWVTEQKQTPPPPEDDAAGYPPEEENAGNGPGLDEFQEAGESNLVPETSRPPADKNRIEVTDPKLLEIFEEVKRYQSRIHGLTEKMKRLHVRVSRLQTVANGELARFWERASAVYPDVWGEDSLAIEEQGDKLFIARRTVEEVREYKHRFHALIKEGVQKGHLPPGFLGVFPEGADE